MVELAARYGQRLWEEWKEYEKLHGTLSGVELARQVQARIGRRFDDTKLSKIRRGKRRATVDEHYALAAALKIEPEKLVGPAPTKTRDRVPKAPFFEKVETKPDAKRKRG